MYRLKISVVIFLSLIGCAENQTDTLHDPRINAIDVNLVDIGNEQLDIAQEESLLIERHSNTTIMHEVDMVSPISDNLPVDTAAKEKSRGGFLVSSSTNLSTSRPIDVLSQVKPPIKSPPLVSKPLKVAGEVFYTKEDKAIEKINVLANDFDANGERLRIVSFTQGKQGVIQPISNGIFRYIPTKDYFGRDQFSYTVANQRGEQSNAVASIVISPVDDLPLAVTDNITLEQLSVKEFNPLTNDKGLGDGARLALITDVSHGSLELNNGIFTYKPEAGYFGPDSFVYKISDADGDVSSANVNINVECVSDCTQRFSIRWDHSKSINVAGYNVYVQDDAGKNSQKFTLGKVSSFDYDAMAKGNYYFAISSYDTYGQESDKTRVVTSNF